MEGETMKPFRWTKQHTIIREALNNDMTKDDIMQLVRKGNKDARTSEAAMAAADWSIAIDRVQQRLSQ
jgi:hypothetical protein